MKRVVWSVVLSTSCALLGACGGEEATLPLPSGVTTNAIKVHVSLEGDPCGVTSATASLEGPALRIPPKALTVGANAIDGALFGMPVAQQHLVYVKAYNSQGQLVYDGNSTVDVRDGSEDSANVYMFSDPRTCPAGGAESLRVIGWLRSTTVELTGSEARLPRPPFAPKEAAVPSPASPTLRLD
ncbi:hypothetical protein DRW03_13405 [Corallococcus sp. H22C18031201]|uniref:hypothetical protein n=1 Tax=Citreicoccus inhibens TaxID=2849499 RepID=UPI000E760CA7|nr:hypothetical protein [Citreicoccus inhibens]MBU8893979.1 hypothetical protein [Citreicoccus inhibens]RJS23292.1 hypothetical protein DRW03_13405 [Corallococcus sp. H22C18031201]